MWISLADLQNRFIESPLRREKIGCTVLHTRHRSPIIYLGFAVSSVQTPEDSKLRELERRFEALNRMVQVSLVMNSTLKLQPLLQYIMEAATEITGAEAASIL